MSSIPRVNRPGPRRRCPPCPACGEDAMRQYGAKHHGVVSRYFYACQQCQHTDVWREILDGPQYFERLRQPLVPPRPEQCRLELRKISSKEAKAGPAQPARATAALSLSGTNNSFLPPAQYLAEAVPRTCRTCARYFPEDDLCHVSEDLLQAMHLALGIAVIATELRVNPKAVTDCSDWLDASKSDRFRLLRQRGEPSERNSRA